MAITAQMVKELREKTGAGMMDCKKALSENGGDEEKAIAWLREKGLSKAAKKAGRATSEGLVALSMSDDGKVAALTEVKCETDFVAKSDQFLEFVDTLSKQVIAEGVPDGDLGKVPYPGGPTAQDGLTAIIAVLGENMQLGRAERLELQGEGGFGAYIHTNGKLGVLVEFGCPASVAAAPGFADMGKDVAMQVAAVSPVCVTSDEVPSDLLEKEMDIYKKQAMAEGKPEAIAEKIVLGRKSKFFKEICLLEQPFIKDDKQSVKDMLKAAGKDLGGDITVRRFVRLALGEGDEAQGEESED